MQVLKPKVGGRPRFPETIVKVTENGYISISVDVLEEIDRPERVSIILDINNKAIFIAKDEKGYKLTYKVGCAFFQVKDTLYDTIDKEAIFQCEPYGKGIIRGTLIDGGFK